MEKRVFVGDVEQIATIIRKRQLIVPLDAARAIAKEIIETCTEPAEKSAERRK